MRSPHSSLDRLRDRETIRLFTDIFIHHGVLGARYTTSKPGYTELDRLRAVPLVFGLLPRQAIFRARIDERVKPPIRTHLEALSVPVTEMLVDVLKRISDQYYETVVCRVTGIGPSGKRKRGIEDIRALRHEYARLVQCQSGRCALCGVAFGAPDARETLDHIIPWYLVGDVFDGANWQILCNDCNGGKRDWMSSLQSSQALNWFYGAQQIAPSFGPSRETRYLVLAQRAGCEVADCERGPRDSRLHVDRWLSTGLAIADNLRVLCDDHHAAHTAGESIEFSEVTQGSWTNGRAFGVLASAPAVSNRQSEPDPSEQSDEASALLGKLGSYVLEDRIPGGGMGDSFRGVDENTGETVFVKCAQEDSELGRALAREARIYDKLLMRGCGHILEARDLIREDGLICLVTEWADGGDLRSVVERRGGRLPTNEARDIALQVAAGLKELHEAGVVHRDLKPGNIVVHEQRYCLVDFGISKNTAALYTHKTFRGGGTSRYAAPEQVLTGHEARATADIYSFGKILVFLLTGDTDIDLVHFMQWRALIRRCTTEVEHERPAISEVIAALASIAE